MARTGALISADRIGFDLFGETLAATRETRSVLVERVSQVRGAMPPLYSTDEHETFHVRSGRVTFFIGVEVVPAKAGDVVKAPAGTARTLRVESEEARWMVATEVRSPARYDDFGRALAAPSGDWANLEEAATVTAIAAANRITILGPPGLLP